MSLHLGMGVLPMLENRTQRLLFNIDLIRMQRFAVQKGARYIIQMLAVSVSSRLRVDSRVNEVGKRV